MSAGKTLYWEDFRVGETVAMGNHTFAEEEMIDFARKFDPQPFHIDPVAAKNSYFGELIASGWHTCAVAMRLLCENYINRSASLGSPGIENVRWLKPVRAGDTISYPAWCSNRARRTAVATWDWSSRAPRP